MPEGRGPRRRHPALQAHRGGRVAQVVPAAVEVAMSANYTEFHPRWYRPRMSVFWWVGRRSYLLFVLRELSSVFVAWSVVFLLLLVHAVGQGGDRKSTRLNSSHMSISYAVFCLKKKKKKNITYTTTKNKKKNR